MSPANPEVINLERPEGPIPWGEWDARVKKIVLGRSPGGRYGGGEEKDKPTTLKALPEDLAIRFPNLTHLYLWGLKGLRTLPVLPGKLECLDCRDCPDLEELPALPAKLEMLDLGACGGVNHLPEPVPPGLRRLYLDGCTGLRRFRPVEAGLPVLERLELHGCKFTDLPDFLCGERGENVIAKVQAHFEAIQAQGAAVLPECKVVVLGNGGVGKTSLVRALKGLPHSSVEEATEGIRLWSWDGDGFVPFPEASPERVQLNIWDFGGQDLYHNTHRLFLESRAIFLVVWRQPRADGRPFRENHPDDPVRPLDYWLDQVRAANPKASILIVRTGMDEDDAHPPEDWKTQVREEYRTLPAFKVSSSDRALGEWPSLHAGLREAVVQELRSLQAVTLGQGRRAVRDRLRQWQPASPDDGSATPDSERPVMRLGEFVRLVQDIHETNHLPAPSPNEALMLLDYLHHCGALYCPPAWRKDSVLQGTFPVIVDQRWAIEGVYELFRPGIVREGLLRAHGVVSDLKLSRLWDQAKDSEGKPRYDNLARWVFPRFMEQCGVLVRVALAEQTDETCWVFPELLPTFEDIAELRAADPLVAAARSAERSRSYLVRDRSLGQGFGCLLVGQLVKLFGRVPLYHYGAIGRVRLGGYERGRRSRKSRDVVVQVGWYRETKDSYQGDVVVTVFGDSGGDAEVLDYCLDQLRQIHGFPPGVVFETRSGALAPDLQEEMDYVRRASRETERTTPPREPTRSLVRLGIVGISAAGEDAENPHIEALPRALEKALNAVPDRSFDVLYYRSDKERKTVSQLMSDLVRSDIMVAFVGRKYLRSEYCMVELLEAATLLQPKDTFSRPADWPERLWLLPLADAQELLARSDRDAVGDQEDPCDRHEDPYQEWKRDWVSRAADYWQRITERFQGTDDAETGAPAEYPFHAWMAFAVKGPRGLALVLAAIRQGRHDWTVTAPPTSAGPDGIGSWAEQSVKSLSQQLVERVNRRTARLTPEEREERLRRRCVRFWNSDERERAAEVFEEWIGEQRDAAQLRQQLLASFGSIVAEDLKPVWSYWRDIQVRP
ncbi:MAG: hypothetical protein H7A45_16400 [Verrucomicrobiales bacterium]|nr:hypothetical protein [Verrucomicrobiales bacterium]